VIRKKQETLEKLTDSEMDEFMNNRRMEVSKGPVELHEICVQVWPAE
jgi:hypothetical protein